MNKLTILIITVLIIMAGAVLFFQWLGHFAPLPDHQNFINGSSSHISYPQKFHVEGNKIIDESGKEVVFRGVNIGSVIAHSYYTKVEEKLDKDYVLWDENYFKQISDFGAKIIRLNILPEDFRTAPEEFSFNAIDQTLEWVSQYQMYVYITYHGIGFPPTEYYGEEPWEIKEKFTATKEEMLRTYYNKC